MKTLLNVNDLKQFVYCPRIVYYTWVIPLKPPATYLMHRGLELEKEFERLETRRVLNRYGLDEGQRHFYHQMTDAGLGLTGKADLVIEGRERIAVVEFKATAGDAAENQRVQVCAYALLAEERFHLPCPEGFILLRDRNELAAVEIDSALRAQTLSILNAAREIVAEAQFPDPTQVRARCAHCEYRNYCGDIF